jgi:hypothetical protein
VIPAAPGGTEATTSVNRVMSQPKSFRKFSAAAVTFIVQTSGSHLSGAIAKDSYLALRINNRLRYLEGPKRTTNGQPPRPRHCAVIEAQGPIAR